MTKIPNHLKKSILKIDIREFDQNNRSNKQSRGKVGLVSDQDTGETGHYKSEKSHKIIKINRKHQSKPGPRIMGRCKKARYFSIDYFSGEEIRAQ